MVVVDVCRGGGGGSHITCIYSKVQKIQKAYLGLKQWY